MTDFSPNRNFGLDVVRAAAITLVLVSHARQMLADPDSGLILTFGGGFGVELFFALSGYLIGTILLRMFSRRVTPGDLADFWFRRWMRTVPPYLTVLAVTALAFGSFDPAYLFFLQGILRADFSIMPVSWSLAVEEWFYLLFPLLALACTAFGRRRGFLIAAIILLVAPILFRVAQYAYGPPLSEFSGGMRKNTFRFDSLAMGVLLAYALDGTERLRLLERHRLVVSLLAAGSFALALGLHASQFTAYAVAAPDWFRPVLLWSAYGFVSVLIVAALALVRDAPSWPVAWPVIYVSRVSYSAYLWHLLFMAALLRVFDDQRGAVLYWAFILGSLAISGAMYVATERPFLRLRDRVSARRSQGSDRNIAVAA